MPSRGRNDVAEDYRDDPPRRRGGTNPVLIVALVLGGVVLVGLLVCGGAFALFWSAPVAAPPGQPVAVAEVDEAPRAKQHVVMAAATLPQTSEARFGGRTVDDYGPLLLDTDRATSLEAAVALGEMGAESLRWFYRGLSSKTEHVVTHSVAYMPGEAAEPYAALFEPHLIPMLSSTDLTRRSQSAYKLAAMKSKHGAKRMRELLADPKTPASQKEQIEAVLKKFGV